MFGTFVVLVGGAFYAGSVNGHPATTYDVSQAARYGYREVAKRLADRLRNYGIDGVEVVKVRAEA
jgi:hypothetical protein